jgi:hypothetical protein
MVATGYGLFSEEHPAPRLVELAQMAERAGFDFATISDHYHPWLGVQGESPFVWGALGAVAAATSRLVLGTAVTCPIQRMHPAIVAQASATAATLAPGRFFLGVGSGENLNEHVLGEHWPSSAVRLERLEEAIEIMRQLWSGRMISHRGRHFTVDRARLYSIPDIQPPVYVAASGKVSAGVAARAGDGMISGSPDADLIQLPVCVVFGRHILTKVIAGRCPGANPFVHQGGCNQGEPCVRGDQGTNSGNHRHPRSGYRLRPGANNRKVQGRREQQDVSRLAHVQEEKHQKARHDPQGQELAFRSCLSWQRQARTPNDQEQRDDRRTQRAK